MATANLSEMQGSENSPLLNASLVQPLVQQTVERVESGTSLAAAGPKRTLGLFDAVALILGLQIGSGIFLSPSLVARNTGSEQAALATWGGAGVLAWTCAACYIELGSRLPVNGGPQEYLTQLCSETLGFVASWICIFVVKPGSAAILALFVANYACGAAVGWTVEQDGFTLRLVAIGLIVLLAVINCNGNQSSGLLTTVMLVCKIISISFVILAGFALVLFHNKNTVVTSFSNSSTPHLDLRSYADALLSAVWAYSGWETLAFVGGELRDPVRNTSKAINLSMAIVIALSLCANLAYFYVLSFEGVAEAKILGLKYCKFFFRKSGDLIFSCIICFSTSGTLHVKIFTGARLTQAAAERGFLPAFLRTINTETCESTDAERSEDLTRQNLCYLNRPFQYRDGTVPISAIIFNALIAAAFVLVGDLVSLIVFIGVADYAVALATLIGLLSLRMRFVSDESLPDYHGFRVPLVFILTAIFTVTVMEIISVYKHPLPGIGFIALCGASASIHTYLRASKEMRRGTHTIGQTGQEREHEA